MVTDIQSPGVISQNFKFLPLISWRAAFAGLAIALLTFLALIALAMAFGGLGLDVDGASAQGLGTFAVVSLLISTIVSLFIGSYFSVRLARINAEAVGSAQGLLVGALFVLFFLFQALVAIGALGRMTGNLLSSTGNGVGPIAQSPMVQDIVADNFIGLNFQNNSQYIVSGVASRLLRGDQEAATSFLARQTGITFEEARQRITSAQAQINQALTQARVVSAAALRGVGWSLFIMIVLGSIASILGGYTAALRNENYTLDMQAITKQRQAPLKPASV